MHTYRPHPAFRRIIHASDAMAELLHKAVALAPGDQPIVFFGAAGSGKGLLARGVHYASDRSLEPFVELDCEGLPEDVLAVELFGGVGGGHDGGTGLLQLAGGGTAFLRQIHCLTPALQSRLAYALTRGISARVFASTKLPPQSFRDDATFDPNLLRLIGASHLTLPRLADRDDDMIVIASEVLLDHGLNNRESPKELAPEAVDRLMGHAWPGNVRELIFVLTAAADACPGPVIGPEHISISVRSNQADSGDQNTIRIPDVGVSLEWIEQEAVRITLRLTDGNKSQAARILGVSRPTLLKKLRALEARDAESASERASLTAAGIGPRFE